MTIFDSETPGNGSSNPPSNPSPDALKDTEIISFLERALAEARAGNVLFLIASVGVVRASEPLVTISGPGDQLPVAAKFAVEVGALCGDRTAGLQPVSFVEGANDVLAGASVAANTFKEEVSARVRAGARASSTAS